jgi:hypothetical protein
MYEHLRCHDNRSQCANEYVDDDTFPATKHRPQTASNHGRDGTQHTQKSKLARPKTAASKPASGQNRMWSSTNRPMTAGCLASTHQGLDQEPDQQWQQEQLLQPQQQQKNSMTALSRLKEELQQLTSRHNVQLQCLSTSPGNISSRPITATGNNCRRHKLVSIEC